MKKHIWLPLVLIVMISCEKGLTDAQKTEYQIKGTQITQAAFKELSGQLMAQMKTGGPEAALPFCSVKALPLTLKTADENGVSIIRNSDKLRNSKNTPSTQAKEQIARYLETNNSGADLLPVVAKDASGIVHYYAPILINKQCLVCHGIPGETMQMKTDSLVKSYYPDDAATGYSVGDLRGIWDVAFTN